MQNRNQMRWLILITMCALFAILSVFSLSRAKKMQRDFNEKKTILINENLYLKNCVDSIQKIVDQKTEFINSIEKEKNIFEKEANYLKEENERIRKTYFDQLEVLKRKRAILKKTISILEKIPILDRIKVAIQKEDNEKVRKILDDAVNKIELIKKGESINLEPIVIKPAEAGLQEKASTIISLDRKNNLIVIDLGRKDGIQEGMRIKILKGSGQEIAQAEIISVRYKVAAAFIDELQPKYTIRDIKEGYRILLTPVQ